MTVLWMDGFGHYGTGTDLSNMLDGVWAQADSEVELSTANPRTGTTSLLIKGYYGPRTVRRVFPNGAIGTVGIGCAIFPIELPVTADESFLISLKDGDNNAVVSVACTTAGNLLVYSGSPSGTLLHTTQAPVIVAGSYQHLEMKVVSDQSAGAVEIRWNEVTVVNISNVNTRPGSVGLPAQVEWRCVNSGNMAFKPIYYLADVFAWDTNGTNNNDFIGDRNIYTTFPDADTSLADYSVVGAANGYDAINEASPDDETSYISLAQSGDAGGFSLQNLPSEVVSISAVQTYLRIRKTDSGDANTTAGFLSGSSTVEGDYHPLTTVYTYWTDIFEVDPATGALWTRAGFNAARFDIIREASP